MFSCLAAVSLAPTGLKCYGIAFGYNGSWNPPVDDGGEAVMKSCYGHIKGRDASCLNSCACQSNSQRVVNHALERGTSYVFYVYAVNSIGNGNCSIDFVATLLGIQNIFYHENSCYV